MSVPPGPVVKNHSPVVENDGVKDGVDDGDDGVDEGSSEDSSDPNADSEADEGSLDPSPCGVRPVAHTGMYR